MAPSDIAETPPSRTIRQAAKNLEVMTLSDIAETPPSRTSFAGLLKGWSGAGPYSSRYGATPWAGYALMTLPFQLSQGPVQAVRYGRAGRRRRINGREGREDYFAPHTPRHVHGCQFHGREGHIADAVDPEGSQPRSRPRPQGGGRLVSTPAPDMCECIYADQPCLQKRVPMRRL